MGDLQAKVFAAFKGHLERDSVSSIINSLNFSPKDTVVRVNLNVISTEEALKLVKAKYPDFAVAEFDL